MDMLSETICFPRSRHFVFTIQLLSQERFNQNNQISRRVVCNKGPLFSKRWSNNYI